uniref:Uncharacterized protein n=1 Tax=Lepeophtheirus salmonis TaxID=72036 RepID=A0A0K2T001_LEPSM
MELARSHDLHESTIRIIRKNKHQIELTGNINKTEPFFLRLDYSSDKKGFSLTSHNAQNKAIASIFESIKNEE